MNIIFLIVLIIAFLNKTISINIKFYIEQQNRIIKENITKFFINCNHTTDEIKHFLYTVI
jgi:hypothetical protein